MLNSPALKKYGLTPPGFQRELAEAQHDREIDESVLVDLHVRRRLARDYRIAGPRRAALCNEYSPGSLQWRRSWRRCASSRLNANGIRAAARKGMFQWLERQNADFVCLQETKAQEHQLERRTLFRPDGYHCYYDDAQKKGYSGVAIYARHKPHNVIRGLRLEEFDAEGRYLEARVRQAQRRLALPAVRLLERGAPGGEVPLPRRVHAVPARLKRRRRDYILCGDWNIAHKKIDLKNWRSNQKNSGFLPEERAWLTCVFDQLGFVDVFRHLNRKPDQYTWWSNRGRAWDEQRRLAHRLPGR